MSKYEAHLLFTKIFEREKKNVKLDFIAKTDENVASTTYGCIRFIDPINFLNESLETLEKI